MTIESGTTRIATLLLPARLCALLVMLSLRQGPLDYHLGGESVLKRLTLIGGVLLALLALADRALTVRDLLQILLKNFSWIELAFLIIGLIPIVLIIAWIWGALLDPPDDSS
jgi:hypothetical protein